MSTLSPVSRAGEILRTLARFRPWLGAVCLLGLIVSPAFAQPAFAQGDSGRAVTDFDELIRREEQKGGAAPAPSSAPPGALDELIRREEQKGSGASASPGVQPSAPATDDLARTVQVELKRVGCDPGLADGIWGPASQQALAAFDRYGRAQYAPATPTPELLDDLRGRTGRVCPAPPPPEPVVSREAEPAPPPEEEVTLAGKWSLRSDCPLDLGAELVLAATGRDQYRISGTGGISGWVSGNRVHM